MRRLAIPIDLVVSMGRRNTDPKSNLQVFQRLNSFESADSRKTLPCLGLIDYSPKDQVSLKTQSDQQIRRVLHRPVEPALVIGNKMRWEARIDVEKSAYHQLSQGETFS